MTDFPSIPPLPLFISTYSRWGAAWDVSRLGGTFAVSADTTWTVADTAYYLPMSIPWPYPVRRVFWANSSATSANVDFGIYSKDGTRIYSTGSTAQSGASAIQYVTPTNFILYPGSYYFAFACSSVTANSGGQGTTVSTVPDCRMAGILQQATALPLPATWTPATVSADIVPFCGVTLTDTGF